MGVSPMASSLARAFSLKGSDDLWLGRDGLEGEGGGERITLREPGLAVGEQRLPPYGRGRIHAGGLGEPERRVLITSAGQRPVAERERAVGRAFPGGGAHRAVLRPSQDGSVLEHRLSAPGGLLEEPGVQRQQRVHRLLIRRGGERAGKQRHQLLGLGSLLLRQSKRVPPRHSVGRYGL